MKQQFRHRLAASAMVLAAGLGSALVTGCTQMPTEKQGVADLRPQISFIWTDPAMAAARVMVDGLPMGEVGQYPAGRAALRVLAGPHDLQVVLQGRTVLAKRIYLGDGVNKAYTLK